MENRPLLLRTIREVAAAHAEALGKDAIDEMAVPAYTRGNALSRYVFWRKLDWIVRLADVQHGENVLDFGCGTGVLLQSWHHAGAKAIFATDLELRVARDVAQRLGLEDVRFLTAEEWEAAIPDAAVDVIVAANVLEHVEDRAALLHVFHRKLRALDDGEGRLIISGPTENALYRLGRRIVGFSGDYHVTTITQILTEVPACGFRLDRLVRWPAPGPGCLYQIARFVKV